MRKSSLLVLLLATPLPIEAGEVPPELRGQISVEVTSCQPLRDGASARAVLVRVRAGARALRAPEIRCAAFAPGTDHGLGWAHVAGLEQLAAEATRAVMTLVAADAAHSECRCVASAVAETGACAPWESLEDGRCVEPGERAAPGRPALARANNVAAALEVSRALAPLRARLEHEPTPGPEPTFCGSVAPAQLAPLVFALVPPDGAVYVTSLWHLLDAADQRAFARWSAACFDAARLIDAERGLELRPGPQPPYSSSAR